MKFKSVEDLKAYFFTLECGKPMQVGASHTNHERAVFLIGCAQILMDTILPYNWLKESSQWYWTGDGMPLKKAEADAVKYNATIEEAYYSDDENERILLFKEIDDILQWLIDNRKKDLEFEADKEKAEPNHAGTWSVSA